MVITLDRFAAYSSACSTLAAIRRATSAWPRDLADRAQAAATSVIANTADAIDKEPTSSARRLCLRDAIVDALVLASICDLASSHGLTSADLDESLRHASRTISMLGLSFHATSTTG